MKLMVFLLSIFLSLIYTKQVFAVCPVCTVAVGAGVGLSRWFGIDDLITGLWIGGLIVSLIMWTLNFLKKRNVNFKGKKIIIILLFYLLTILPLYFTNIMGHPQNIFIFGIDKLLFSIIIGSISFYIGGNFYEYLKDKNKGHAHFPFEKVVMPIAPLIILSIFFYFLTK